VRFLKEQIDISKPLNENLLGKFLGVLGLSLLGHSTYSVIRGNKPQIEALRDWIKNQKMKKEYEDELLDLWRDLRNKSAGAQEAADKFQKLTGIRLEV
jgi:hypothetical protein